MDYQPIIEVVSQYMMLAVPIVIIFKAVAKITHMFFSFAFGERRIKL